MVDCSEKPLTLEAELTIEGVSFRIDNEVAKRHRAGR